MIKSIVWNGKQISKPGVYAEVPLVAYHSQSVLDGPSVSSSNLRRVLDENGGSPAHFYCTWTGNPNCEDEDDNKALIVGRATHHLLLGQSQFSREFIVRPEEIPDKHGVLTAWQSNKTVCRDWTARALGGGYRWHADRYRWAVDPEQPPLTILTNSDIAAIQGMALALARHPLVKPQDHDRGLLNGAVERSFFWKDKRTGLWLKSRPDAVPTDSGDFADLKTTTSVAYPRLVWTISECAYHQQAAMVVDGAKACADIEFSSYSFVFVEKKPPYCARVVQLKPDWIELGRRQNRRALDTIARCIDSGRWPGPGDDNVDMIDLSERYRQEAELNNQYAATREAS